MSLQHILKRVLVVGDRLKDFSIHEKTITISELEKLIDSQIDQRTDKYVVSIGQGISEDRLKSLCKNISNSNLENIFKLKIPSTYNKSCRYFTHKHMIENIMISIPSKNDDGSYESALMLDDSAAEMSDHFTGQHIQGMVLIEAARQMVIAITKKYLISEDYISDISFVTHNTNALFYEFVFPLPVTIKYEIIELKNGLHGNLTSKSRISFIQNDAVAAEIIFSYSALNTNFLKDRENFLAGKNIEAHFLKEQLI